ncbi:Late embryogenesis abundant (LEA) hydroxyproline-rich glycoprotein family [Thalictrum thalictroides]|uniref:Late embryogenesis abundant (LEA) hydroxyproline-rich glycoprotein family n=1 Tax=Thalictrum thalictroides TaxID=46969 RepID=A0A7J6V393_THATH|nr:Late embryogenesis abundant (LEA) hydroxyproline-rich glycoprotein family [Thalictrum thalictroides]
MASFVEEDPNKHVIGYPSACPRPHPASCNHIAYPRAQTTDPANTSVGYPCSTLPPFNQKPCPAQASDPHRSVRRVMICLVSTILIFCIISFITWLIFRPKTPEFRVDSVTIPPLNTSTLVISPHWEIGLSVKNPNKKINILYDEMEAGIYYGEECLSEAYILPYTQEKNNEMVLWAKFDELDDPVANLITKDRKSGVISLKVKVVGWVTYEAGAWKTSTHLMEVTCKNIRVGFDMSTGVGTYLSGSESCDVYISD